MGDVVGDVFDTVGGIFGGSDAPDPQETANAQSSADASIARLEALLNRYNQNTPYGSLSWSQDATNPDLWTSTVSLSPEQQKLLTAQQGNQQSLSNVLSSLLGTSGDMLSSGVSAPAWNLSSADSADTTRQAITDAIYGQMTSRLDPQFEQAGASLDSKLANQGITQGSSAYDTEMGNFSRDKNDAYTSARNSAITQGQQAYLDTRDQTLQERAQQIGEQTGLRSNLINIINALQNGTQVTSPSFSGQNTSVALPNSTLSENIYADYNANTASQNSLLSALGSLGSAYLFS